MSIDLRPHLRRCGYRADLLVEDYEYLRTDGQSGSVPLLAFADQPTDARSACIAVISGNGNDGAAVRSAASTGAPYALVITTTGMEWWLNRREQPTLHERVPLSALGRFFDDNRPHLEPDRVFRAKTLGSLDRQQQLTFVDVGLMPMVEGEIGERLSGLIGRVVKSMLTTLGKTQPTPQLAARVFQVAFWLLAGKMLRDKRVLSFKTLDVTAIDDVFERVGRHYGVQESPPRGATWTRAAQRAALEVANFATLANVSTESLGYLYESTMVPPHVRKALGIHSTPAYLIDYMVWQMADWVAELPEDKRHVFEPACGHGGFLVASIRLLRELLGEVGPQQRTRYLRSHIHGMEVDSFAVEIARLSLTLADIPNPNGWQLVNEDMFTSDALDRELRRAGIVLANPPFENFSSEEKRRYSAGRQISSMNKTDELIRRIIPALQARSAFGLVVPQTFLHGKPYRETRRELLSQYELREICLFPDKVFGFADSESAIIIGRRPRTPPRPQNVLKYRAVREGALGAFRASYAPSSTQLVTQERLARDPMTSMRVPELEELWGYLDGAPKLHKIARVGKGLIYHGKKLPEGAMTVSKRPVEDFKPGFDTIPTNWQTHDLPSEVWLNHDPEVVQSWNAGAWTGAPQVIVNYARVSRGPWRLKAGLDKEGHAATSRFLTARPVSNDVPVEYLWAIFNAPTANAYVYCHTMKRDNQAGLLRTMPVPESSATDRKRIGALVDNYFIAVRACLSGGDASAGGARDALMRLDAEVLHLYDLPPRLERQLLDLFEGHQRSGVPFRFTSYFPTGLTANIPLHRLLSDDFARSTAGRLRRRHEPLHGGPIQAALDVAASSFTED